MSFFEKMIEALFGHIHFTVTAEEHIKQGTAKLAIGDIQGALHDFNAVVEQEPENPMGYYNRGLLYQHLDKHDLAVEDMLTAHSLFQQQGNTDYLRMVQTKLRELGREDI